MWPAMAGRRAGSVNHGNKVRDLYAATGVGAYLSYYTRLHVWPRVILWIHTRLREEPRILHNIRGYTRYRGHLSLTCADAARSKALV